MPLPKAARLGRLAVFTVTALSTALLIAQPASAADHSRYVALGDSFTAGPLIPNQSLDVPGCLRSDHNYAALLAEDLAVDEFVDASCSGATTKDMFAPQSTFWGTNAPQLDSVTSDTTLVTIGISGNDVGFMDVLITCLSKGLVDPWGNPCQRSYNANGYDELKARIADVQADVAAVVQAVHDRAPSAEVVLVGYPALLPEKYGCWWKATIAAGDVPYLDGIEQDLNGMLADTAEAGGARYVGSYERGHSICASWGDRWVESVIPTQPAAPVHPNARGMRAVDANLADALS